MKRTTVRFVVLPLVLLTAAALAVGACTAGSEEEAAPAEAPRAEQGSDSVGGAAGADFAGDVAVEEAAPPAEPAEPAPAAEPPAEEPAGEVVPISGTAPPIQPRVIQTASLSVTVPKGDFEEVVDQARQTAATLGGFVTSSSASQGGDDRLVRGSLVVRVPEQTYAQAMSQFAQLGKVVGRQESGTDVSLQYVDLEARARHLEAVEQQLLGFLNETETVSDALVIQQQLNDVQLQLEEVRGQLRYLDDQSSFATISLEIAERGVPVAKPKGDDGGWSLADAWHAAARGFEAIVGGALVVLVTAGPILAALALAFFAGRAYLRRRKPAPTSGGPAETPTG
jgi:hypothetical protein